jgi:hypothetical protein
MMQTRREFMGMVPALGAWETSFTQNSAPAADPEWPSPAPSSGAPVDDSFPSHHPALAKEMVAVSHFDAGRVRELLARHPELAKASWDWGFGDWETALGAASHIGNRVIAELLLDHGAAPTHFSAAMLGQVDVLRSFLAARPGLQRMRGPHGLTLMVHAKKGGPQAAAVVALLESLGDADVPYRDEPVTPEDRKPLEGRYTFGGRPRDSFVVSTVQGALMIARVGTVPRGLFHQGGLAFHPAGAESVAIRFERDSTQIVALTIAQPGGVLRAIKS